jgi:rhamnogalacturonan endolyase
MRRGVSGVYQFGVFSKPQENPSEMPSGLDLTFRNERVMKVDSSIFHYAAVSDSLQGEIYDRATVQKIKERARELANATDRQADGRIWAKYSWCPYEQESKVHGVTGDGVGVWVIIPNDESGYNLPSDHPGSINDDGDGGAAIVIITHQEGAPHNIGSEQWANRGPEPWEKLYGPILLYVNSGASHAAMWADAKRRAEVEAAAHPAAWMQNDLYPLARASIRGRVLTADGKPAAGAWVILCHPNPNPDAAWQRHIGPYIYRTFAAYDGTFEIKGVRPDSYSLFARIDGSLGLSRTDGIALKANQQQDSGVLTITERPHGKLLWEIGSPDGTSREFLGALDSHEFCGWTNNYRRFFPNDVDFTIGKSDPARDWYYCQPGGWPDGYSSKAKPTQWRIHFDLPEVPANGAMLTICIAATRGGPLSIQCNETKLPVRQIPEGDHRTSLCAAPDRGSYYGFRTEQFEIDSSSLHVGQNTIALQFGSGRNPFEAIMYDYLKLESR